MNYLREEVETEACIVGKLVNGTIRRNGHIRDTGDCRYKQIYVNKEVAENEGDRIRTTKR